MLPLVLFAHVFGPLLAQLPARAPRPGSVAGLVLGSSLALATTGCGRKAEAQWIPDDAAVVRCTVSGPNLQLPHLVDELATPLPPTGLLARKMDPIALDELGYERDRIVCATMQTPSAEELERASAAIEELSELRKTIKPTVRNLGRCRCTYAEAIDAKGLISGCRDTPTDESCEPEAEQVEALQEALAPLRAKLETTEVPRIHWRLVGRSDRLGRFAARRDELIARHPGGSEVYVPGNPLPPRYGAKLIAAMLSEDHVVAVVSQDSGQGLLVVREIGNLLVLDHFSHPDWGGHARADEYILLTMMEDAQIERYRAALDAPTSARALQLEARDGYLIEVDRDALERVDRAAEISTNFVARNYDPAREQRVLPPLLTDRVTLQVPFGTEGTTLRARYRLTKEGRKWTEFAAGAPLAETLADLGEPDVIPRFVAARGRAGGLFQLRGTATERLLFAGLTGLPKVLLAIEAANPGSIEGDFNDWQVALPSGPLPGELKSRDGVRELRERLSIDPHTLSGGLSKDGGYVDVELARR